MHRMTCTAREVSGRERWDCGECDRVLLITWPPPGAEAGAEGRSPFEVLIEGDSSAAHSGGRGVVALRVGIHPQ